MKNPPPPALGDEGWPLQVALLEYYARGQKGYLMRKRLIVFGIVAILTLVIVGVMVWIETHNPGFIYPGGR